MFDIGYMNTALPDNIKFTPPGSTDYAELAEGLGKMAATISGNAPGDPEKCVSRMIDVIKSEGLAAGKPTPLIVPMGSDAYLSIKKNAEKTLRICEEWKEISQSVDFPGPRRGFFVDKEYYE